MRGAWTRVADVPRGEGHEWKRGSLHFEAGGGFPCVPRDATESRVFRRPGKPAIGELRLLNQC